MEGATYNSMDRLYKFLRKFLPVNSQDLECNMEDGDVGGQADKDASAGNGANEEHMQASCSYCGASVAYMPMNTTGLRDCICPLCREELIRQKDLFYQTVEETVRNVAYMFSVPWNKRIQVEKCNKLESSTPKAAGGRKKKKEISIWAVNLEPQFVQTKMDDDQKICVFKICTAIPSGIVVASAAYTTIYDYLHLVAKKNELSKERMAGLAYWYMVHYLRCVDHERYVRHYNQVVEQLIREAGAAFYWELQEERRNQTNHVFSVSQDFVRACQQREEYPALIEQAKLSQEKNEAAPDF